MAHVQELAAASGPNAADNASALIQQCADFISESLAEKFAVGIRKVLADTVVAGGAGKHADAMRGKMSLESFLEQAARLVHNAEQLDSLVRGRAIACDQGNSIAINSAVLAAAAAAAAGGDGGGDRRHEYGLSAAAGAGAADGDVNDDLSVDESPAFSKVGTTGITSWLAAVLRKELAANRTASRRLRRCVELYWKERNRVWLDVASSSSAAATATDEVAHAQLEEQRTTSEVMQQAYTVGLAPMMRECATDQLLRIIDGYVARNMAEGSVGDDDDDNEEEDDDSDDEGAPSRWHRQDLLDRAVVSARVDRDGW